MWGITVKKNTKSPAANNNFLNFGFLSSVIFRGFIFLPLFSSSYFQKYQYEDNHYYLYFFEQIKVHLYSQLYIYSSRHKESWCSLSGPHPGGLKFIFSLNKVGLLLKSFFKILLIDLSSIKLVKYLLFL